MHEQKYQSMPRNSTKSTLSDSYNIGKNIGKDCTFNFPHLTRFALRVSFQEPEHKAQSKFIAKVFRYWIQKDSN